MKDLASRLLREFAEERRRILSDWRILITARRIAHAENAPLPDEKKALAIARELVRRGDLVPVEGAKDVYVVDIPYANLLNVSEELIVQEANPWAVFGFLTAMVQHGLTDNPPTEIFAIQFKDGEHLRRVPLGTMPDDWVGIRYPPSRQPRKFDNVAVHWTEMQGKWEFGITIGYSSGLPIYVTDVERTLLDALRMPEKCGGIAKVFKAWRDADNAHTDQIIKYTDQFDIQNLRQRVGFLLQTLGREHVALDRWRSRLQRGGSVKLVAGEPYAETYSAEWNLSLNVPSSVLAIIEQE
jgi:predicted transcriptional regulator of viral defense system